MVWNNKQIKTSRSCFDVYSFKKGESFQATQIRDLVASKSGVFLRLHSVSHADKLVSNSKPVLHYILQQSVCSLCPVVLCTVYSIQCTDQVCTEVNYNQRTVKSFRKLLQEVSDF